MIDFSDQSDVTHVTLYFVALVSFLATSRLYASFCNLNQAFNKFSREPLIFEDTSSLYINLLFAAISIAITIIYFNAVGFNMVSLVLSGAEIGDYSATRLSAYSGDTYFAPGYVNQFKNALLPVTLVSVGFFLRRRSIIVKTIYGVSAALLLVFALAGTGQRGYLLYTGIAILFGVTLQSIGQAKKKLPIGYMLLGIPFIFTFLQVTSIYQGGGSDDIFISISKTIERVFFIQQEGGLIGFRHIWNEPTTWFKDWGNALIGILPGQDGSLIAHDVHEIMYGSRLGTVPLSNIGSAYYNGGAFGVCLLFGGLGIVYTALYHRLLNGEKTPSRCICYGFIFFYASSYVAGDPVGLALDNGIVTIIIFRLIVRSRFLFSTQRHRSHLSSVLR